MSDSSNNGQRQRMDLSNLEATIEHLHSTIGGDVHRSAVVEKKWLEQAVTYLEYLSEKTENNRLYHKKQNKKKQIAYKMLKQLMSKDELQAIDKQAALAIGDTTAEDSEELNEDIVHLDTSEDNNE